MKLTPLFPIVPLLSPCALPTTSSTGLPDHKLTIARDGDGPDRPEKLASPKSRSSRSGPSIGGSVHRPDAPRSSEGCSSESLAVEVQRELRRRGHDRGFIDGDAGPGTRAAIRASQSDRGLSATGRIDRSLLHALGIGQGRGEAPARTAGAVG